MERQLRNAEKAALRANQERTFEAIKEEERRRAAEDAAFLEQQRKERAEAAARDEEAVRQAALRKVMAVEERAVRVHTRGTLAHISGLAGQLTVRNLTELQIRPETLSRAVQDHQNPLYACACVSLSVQAQLEKERAYRAKQLAKEAAEKEAKRKAAYDAALAADQARYGQGPRNPHKPSSYLKLTYRDNTWAFIGETGARTRRVLFALDGALFAGVLRTRRVRRLPIASCVRRKSSRDSRTPSRYDNHHTSSVSLRLQPSGTHTHTRARAVASMYVQRLLTNDVCVWRDLCRRRRRPS